MSHRLSPLEARDLVDPSGRLQQSMAFVHMTPPRPAWGTRHVYASNCSALPAPLTISWASPPAAVSASAGHSRAELPHHTRSSPSESWQAVFSRLSTSRSGCCQPAPSLHVRSASGRAACESLRAAEEGDAGLVVNANELVQIAIMAGLAARRGA